MALEPSTIPLGKWGRSVEEDCPPLFVWPKDISELDY